MRREHASFLVFCEVKVEMRRQHLGHLIDTGEMADFCRTVQIPDREFRIEHRLAALRGGSPNDQELYKDRGGVR